jgi:accessory gene regulator protein AgrB
MFFPCLFINIYIYNCLFICLSNFLFISIRCYRFAPDVNSHCTLGVTDDGSLKKTQQIELIKKKRGNYRIQNNLNSYKNTHLMAIK